LSLVSEDSMYCCRLVGCMVRDRRPCIVMKWFGNGHLPVPVGECAVIVKHKRISDGLQH
jgi:hypothetical protein